MRDLEFLQIEIEEIVSNKVITKRETEMEKKCLQVFCLYMTGHLEEVFDAEHRKEMLRYIYCHQVLWAGDKLTAWILLVIFI